MYTWVRSTRISSGKQPQATEWALEIAGYVNGKFGLNAIVEVNVTGHINEIHWVVKYDSLADLEQARMATIADEGMQQRLAVSAEQGLFVENSAVDNIYQTIG